MKITCSNSEKLIIVDFPYVIGLFMLLFASVIAFLFSRDILRHDLGHGGVVGACGGIALLLFGSTALTKRTIFTFDRVRSELVWSRMGLLGRKGATVPFDQITGSIVQADLGNKSRCYRVALTTKHGVLPLTESYSGIQNPSCETVSGAINEFLGINKQQQAQATEADLRALIADKRFIEAIQMTKNLRGCSLSEAKKIVDKLTVASGGKPSTTPDDDDESPYTAPRVSGSERKSVFGSWFSVVVVAGVGWWFFPHSSVPLMLSSGYPNPLLYLFGPIALFLIFRAVWETFRLKRFGDPILELNSGQGTIGGMVEGRLSLGSNVSDAPEFTLTLACIRRVHESGGGKGSHDHETVLWSAEHKSTLLIGGILPISFNVPAEQPATDDSDPFNQVLWRLTIKAPFRGVSFFEKYEIPVYDTK
jgi:hypothetical protein